MAKQTTKPTNTVIAVPLSASLESIAAQVAGALQETASLSETLGELTIQAGKEIVKKPDMLSPFVDACRQMCDAHGLSEGSVKVYLSNMRGVLRAMVAGFKPKAGQTLRSMYESAPKGTGRQKAPVKSGARHATDKPDADDMDDDAAAPAKSPADAKREAMVTLFGHADDELAAAIAWAAKNELAFIRYVKANIAAAQAPVALKKAA